MRASKRVGMNERMLKTSTVLYNFTGYLSTETLAMNTFYYLEGNT